MDRVASTVHSITDMRLRLSAKEQQEAVGIVISDGGRSDAAPRFSAFVWGPVPDDVETLDEVRELLAAS